MCCCGRRRRRQPLIFKAAMAGSALAAQQMEGYKGRQQQRQVQRSSAYPDTLDAPAEVYGDVPTVPPYANANTLYTERDGRDAPEVTPLDPPTYEVATRDMSMQQPATPIHAFATVQQGQPRGTGYPPEPHAAQRPQPIRRGSSTSSDSSISTVSSMNSNEYEPHARNFVTGNATPMIPPYMNHKQIAKHERKYLKRALKRSKTHEEAALIILGSMSTLLRVDPAQMVIFSATPGETP